uniref:Acyl-[acyl-carrier-protein]--UDP-N-acetylglucosamine O-acyltransferase n=1 Tax=Desulfobacca acetoxidans TaxID=60893 RepID=A0A7C3YZQ5_9BACT
MAKIHPTAIVDPGAELAESVTIGPYAIISGQVVVGPDTEIGPHAIIKEYTTIGSRCRIFQFAVLGEIPQDLKFAGERSSLVIGDDNTIREFATMHRGTTGGGGVTRVGNGNLFMAYSHVAHDCTIGNGVILSNAASLAGHILVEDRAILGGFVAVHQFCRIGRHAFIGGASAVSRDVPPYTMAVGNRAKLVGLNLVGLKRSGMSDASVQALRQAYEILFHSDLNTKEAVARVRQDVPQGPEVQHLLWFVENSERGLVPVDAKENRSHRG